MFRPRLTLTAVSIAAATAVALPAGATAAGSANPSAATHVRTVCAEGAYVKARPAAIPVDWVVKGEKIDVARYSPSRGWAYGRPRGSQHAHLNGGAWIKVSDLCRRPNVAASASKFAFASASAVAQSAATTRRYSVRIAPGANGTGPVYVGGLSNITVKDRRRAGQRLQLCITPAPTERPSCRGGRTGRTIDTIAWSQAVRTKVRIAIEGGPVIVRYVNVRQATR